MTAISKSFVVIADSAVDPDSPLDTTLITALRDNAIHVREWLGASYTGGAVQNHNHDGVNSAKLQVGSNMLRNGDFESGLTGWTATQYTGGTVAASTTDADGTASVQITSTVLANGGGDVLSNEFMVVDGSAYYKWSVNNWASVANVSSKLEALFYDQAQAAISTSVLLTNTNTPTSNTRTCGAVAVPATARFMKIKATGGIPATGSAVGTVYFDAIHSSFRPAQPAAGASAQASIIVGYPAPAGYTNVSVFEVSVGSIGDTAYVELANARINTSGTYRVAYTPLGYYAQLYKNGVALGSLRTNTIGVEWTEDFTFVAGDTVQVFGAPYTIGHPNGLRNFYFNLLTSTIEGVVPPTSILIGKR